MKNKVVVWGTNEQEEKVLIALELQSEANKVMLYTFPAEVATDEFVNKMMNEWRDGKSVEFPEGHTTLERELSVTESLLPDGLKVDRSDVVVRAQTEWHFSVLSSKLHAAYQQELAEYQEKVRSLSSYDAGMWDALKQFWDKVQGQSRDRNLFRNHADNLRDNINVLFEDLKKLRSQVKNEFQEASTTLFDDFSKAIADLEGRIETGGTKLNSVFDELKALQARYRNARLTNEHRNKVWDRLDAAFKAAKERKFGPSVNEGSVVERHDRRMAGLQDAIKRMEDSIRRDEEELDMHRKKVNTTDGQLEAQIRMAKIKMVEERLNSKREKVAEMQHTMNDVQRQAGNAKEREQKRADREAERQRFQEAKEKAKVEIAAGIRSRDGGGRGPAKEEGFFEAAGTVLGDVLMDALDTIKAVGVVAAEKAGEAVAEVVEKIEEATEALTRKDEAPAEAAEAPAAEVAVEEAPAPATESVETPVEEAPAPEAAADEVVAAAEPVELPVDEAPVADVEVVTSPDVAADAPGVPETPAVADEDEEKKEA